MAVENEVRAFFEKNQKYILAPLILLISFFGCIAIGDQALIKDYWGIILWVFAALLAITSLVEFSSLKKVSFSWKTACIFISLFFFAFLMRAVNISNIPALLNGDESGSAIDALNFITGEKNNIFITGWFSFPAMHPFIQSLFIRLLGQNAAGVRMSSVLIGSLTVPFLYLITKRLFDEPTAIIAALLLSVFPLHNHMSRIGLNNIWDPFFYLLVVGFFWDGWKNHRRFSYVIAGLALGFSQYFYATSRVLIPLALIILLVFFLVDRKKTKEEFSAIIMMFVLGIVIMMPLYYCYSLHPEVFSEPFTRVSVFNRGWLALQQQEGRTIAGVFLQQFLNTIKGIVITPVNGYYEAGTPALTIPTGLLFSLGFIILTIQLIIKKFRDERILILFGWMATILLSVMLSIDAPASHRYTAALPVFSIISVVGLLEGLNYFKLLLNKRPFNVQWIAVVITLILVAKDGWFYLKTYPTMDTLGGLHTLLANDFAQYLRATEEPDREVIFFGYPQFGYESIPALPFLVPEMETFTSMTGPWGEAPETPEQVGDRVTFFFLDIRTDDMAQIEELFEGGYMFARCFTDSPIWDGCYYIYEYDRTPVNP